jgi:ATP-dependent Clp protease protease subunit
MEKIRRDTDRDFFLNAKEAIDYGLADAIAESC